jgi:hypothetical protein
MAAIARPGYSEWRSNLGGDMSKQKKPNNGPFQRAREVVEATLSSILPSATKAPKRNNKRKRKAQPRA